MIYKELWAKATHLASNAPHPISRLDFLGCLLYRHASERLVETVRERMGVEFAGMPDAEAEAWRAIVSAEIGYFLLPSELFSALTEGAGSNAALAFTLEGLYKSLAKDNPNGMLGMLAHVNPSNGRLGQYPQHNHVTAQILRAVAEA
jgi:hypothetical protein